MKNGKINVLWVESRSYLPEYVLPKHTHSFFHYISVIGGSGEITIDDTTHKLRTNYIYLVGPNTEHSFCASKDSKLVTKEIKFEVMDEDVNNTLKNFPHYINCSNTHVYDIFNRIHTERITKRPLYQRITGCLLEEAFLYLERTLINEKSFRTLHEQDESVAFYDDISKIKVYIANNVANNITLQELADVCNLEKTYFLKKFKKITGKTPMQYVKEAKLSEAKKLLLYSNMNITQISEALNFSSIHRFSEFFCKETGMSPQKFKKSKEI